MKIQKLQSHRVQLLGLSAVLMLGACASTPPTPAALNEARRAVQMAEQDPIVQAQAPMELKKASDSLLQANAMQAKGEAGADVTSAAKVTLSQVRSATAVAQAKNNDKQLAGAELERQRDLTDRARQQTGEARQQTAAAVQQTAAAEQRAAGAQTDAAVAQAAAGSAQMRNAELQQQLNELKAQQTERGLLVTLGDVLFETNRAEVKPAAQASLRKLASFLQQYPQRQVLIEGFTDNVGSAAYNQALSLRRADAVSAALQQAIGGGAAAKRISTVGYGEDFPVASNSSDSNRAMNRRVEVYIADNDQPVRARR